MVRAVRKRCTFGDDNLCAAADAFIHSKRLIHFAILRQGPLPPNNASVASLWKSTHRTNTDKRAFSLTPRRNRITTQPKIGIHAAQKCPFRGALGAIDVGCFNQTALFCLRLRGRFRAGTSPRPAHRPAQRHQNGCLSEASIVEFCSRSQNTGPSGVSESHQPEKSEL